MTEDEMVGWHHRLSGHKFMQTPGDSEGQESLVCCSPWGDKESDTTEQLTLTHLFPWSLENVALSVVALLCMLLLGCLIIA